MEYSSAEMTCVLKVNSECESCKIKVMEVLQNVRGVYTISIDADQGTVKVTGKVNPNVLLGVLERYGKHAEVKWVKFDGEVRERSYYYQGYAPPPYGVSYHYPMLGGPEYYPMLGGPEYHFPPPFPPPPRPPPPPPPPPPLAPPMGPFPPRPPPLPKLDDNYQCCIQ